MQSILILLFASIAAMLLIELALVTRKSLRESRLAFLYPRMASSEVALLASRLDRVIKTGDKRSIQEMLVNAGLLRPDERLRFSDLERIERFLFAEYEKRFEDFLFYMPENLRSLFDECKIIRDCENLKTLIRCSFRRIPSQECMMMLGPTGKMSYETLRQISESKDIKEIIHSSGIYLPSEVISGIDLQDKTTLEEIETSIDRAAAAYVAERCSRMKVGDPRRIRNILTLRYEIRDIVAIARLKKAGVPPERFKPLLIDQGVYLRREEFEALVSAENYHVFYRRLLGTHYGSILPEVQMTPTDLETTLNNLLSQTLYTQVEPIKEESIIRYMNGLEYAFHIIWRAMVFLAVRG